jgi:hypothetical protein
MTNLQRRQKFCDFTQLRVQYELTVLPSTARRPIPAASDTSAMSWWNTW